MKQKNYPRTKFLALAWYFLFLVIIGRLFYWQIIRGNTLQAAAQNQYSSTLKRTFSRGRIFTADDYLLVGNQTVYRLFAEPKILDKTATEISDQILPIILDDYADYAEASESAIKDEIQEEVHKTLVDKLNTTDKSWVLLKSKISADTKEKLASMDIKGIGFDPYEIRLYPEASMAAHVTGFVGKNEEGEDTGYFGIEGAMDKELQGRTMSQQTQTDAFGLQLIFSKLKKKEVPGRDVVLTIHRDIQLQAEKTLQKGIEKYQAKSGEIIIMDPKTGEILALAAAPKYDQATFYKFDPIFYKNPTLASTYEPGSTFKTMTTAAGINEGVIKPDTQCPSCDGPVKIGEYTIKTWNQVYNPDISMTDALAKSDNTAMVYIAQLLGKDKFLDYLRRFHIGQEIHIDLQEDTNTPIRDKWGDIHLATSSFGQGIVTNTMQMVRAVGAIANGGVMMRPYIVDRVIEASTQKEMITKPIVEDEVISADAAKTVTEMMVAAAEHGEAQWTASKDHRIAGKTGTSQVAVEGGYAEDKTIASFIGFAPADDPQFVMIVKLDEPTVSPWAAETAAPLWYELADKLFLLLNIPPDK